MLTVAASVSIGEGCRSMLSRWMMPRRGSSRLSPVRRLPDFHRELQLAGDERVGARLQGETMLLSDLCTADSMAIVGSQGFPGIPVKTRITGCDIFC